jgi:DNA-binding protein H-NS
MSIGAYVVNVGGQRSLVFGVPSAEEACASVLRHSYPTEVSEATESDLSAIGRVELMSLLSAGGVQIRKIGRVRKPSSPKYQHPEDPSKTWTGRGRAPAWMQKLLSKGFKKSDFLIGGNSEDEYEDEEDQGEEYQGEEAEGNEEYTSHF